MQPTPEPNRAPNRGYGSMDLNREHPMLAIYSAARIDLATDTAIPMLAAHGVSGVTPGSVARECGCSRQAVSQWFGGQEALLRAIASRFAARWTRWMQLRVHGFGAVGLLPDDERDVECLRARLALTELGRHDAEVGQSIAHLVDVESRALQHKFKVPRGDQRERTSGSAPAGEQLAPTGLAPTGLAPTVLAPTVLAPTVLTLVEGLRVGLCRREDPLTTETARDLLDWALSRLRDQGALISLA